MVNSLEEILILLDKLPLEQQVELLHKLLAKLSIPLQNPIAVFDDWDDKEVDNAYAKIR